MMQFRHRVWMMLFAAAAGLGTTPACTGTETGNPISAELRVRAHSSNPGAFAVRVAQGGAVVDQAWLVLDAIQFADAGDCEAEPSALVTPPILGIADHAAGAPLLAVLDLPAGDYCRVAVPFRTAAGLLPPGAPAELASLSMLIAGQIPGSPAPVSFRIESRLERSVDVRALGGSFPMRSESDAIFLGFDVAAWLGDIDFASAVRDVNGVIRIDQSSNPGLLTAFEAAVIRGVELYRDGNRDGAVTSEEEDPPLARGLTL